MSARSLVGIPYAYLTSVPVLTGVIFGITLVDSSRYSRKPWQSLAEVADYGVGHRYATIASHGYDLADDYAFFPLFPLLGKAIGAATGMGSKSGLLIVAYIALGAAFVALRAYAGVRYADEPDHNRDYVLLAFGLWPTTFFFRMAYSESLFLLLVILALLSIEKKYLWTGAAIAGLASAARPVGIALALPVAMSAWVTVGSAPRRLARTLFASVLACWGLVGYMVYQHRECGDALAFVHAQAYWRVRPKIPVAKRAIALATAEPITGLYDRSSSIYWSHKERHRVVLFSFLAANAPLFLAVVLGVGIGWRRGWLNANELALSAGLLTIPYLTRAYEMGMSSMGRFASVAFPFYLVAGKALWSMPRSLAAVLLALAATFLMFYSSLVAAGFTLR
jgi:hypothetical protein